MQSDWKALNQKHATLKRELTELQVKFDVEGLDFSERVKLTELTDNVRDLGYQLRKQANENRAVQNYIYAAEGFLQVLEKTEDQWCEGDREWLLDDSKEVGMLLIQCMEGGVHWNELTEEEQSLIIDFANIFENDSKQRTAQIEQNLVDDYSIDNLVEVTA